MKKNNFITNVKLDLKMKISKIKDYFQRNVLHSKPHGKLKE